MSADRLREAAKVLRERAETCAEESLHPWVTEDDSPRDFTTVIDQNGWRITEGPDQMLRPTAAYVATMHPGVALALADWLDDLADHDASDLMPMERGAFTIADLILGGAA